MTLGGFPAGRPTLICGGPGCGKTLLATSFLVNGAVMFDEPGVFMTFEESSADLIQNVASLGYDLAALVSDKKISMDFVRLERSEIEESGEYDLEGLFVRLGHAIKQIVGAKRVVLDTLEVLFAGLGDTQILRAELRRLFGLAQRDRRVSAKSSPQSGAVARLPDSAWKNTCQIAWYCSITEWTIRVPRRGVSVRSQIPRLGARHERVSLPY